MMKKLFKILSGKPKNGDIIESVNPFIVIPQTLLSLLLMIIAIKEQQILTGILALLFAWQIGWGMSIDRYMNMEDKKNGKI